MAGPYSLLFKPDNDPGEKLAPEVVAEIAIVAPSTVTSGSITTAKLAEKAVTTSKIDDLGVTTEKIADGDITTVKIAANGVTAAKIEDHCIGPLQTDTGVVTIVDSTATSINARIMRVTAAQMATINAGTPDPNTLYLIN